MRIQIYFMLAVHQEASSVFLLAPILPMNIKSVIGGVVKVMSYRCWRGLGSEGNKIMEHSL
jgi:hypothetical protein